MPDFKLPDLGEGVTEAEVDTWLVKEGDTVAEDDPLVEVITDKATAEIPSPYAGLVSKIHVAAGEVVPVGTALITIEPAGAEAPPPTGDGTAPGRAADPGTPPPGARDAQPRTAPSPGDTAEEDRAVSATDEATPPLEPGVGVKALPPVRKLARRLAVDVSTVQGSGPRGQVLREDVVRAAERSARPHRDAERREPLRGVRRLIAERMSAAHRIVPPVTHVEECDVTELEATRKLANERYPEAPRLTYLPFIIKATIACLKDYPALNASLDEEAAAIVYHNRYDIGIAVDTPQGLTVPVVRDADGKSLRELAAAVEELAKAGREGRLTADQLTGSTFTITSPGPYGGLLATPIVFHPQSGILGVHRAGDRAVVRDGQIMVRRMMNLSVTFDHRVLDGMTAARFMLDLVKLLEHPAVLALAD
jgi:pyruvate dehydrogenase E2 component (dihydrolipoyllysine-residue acetyltransferase)